MVNECITDLRFGIYSGETDAKTIRIQNSDDPLPKEGVTMGWQPPTNLTTKFNAPLMFGKPACYIHYTQNIVYVGFTPGVGPNGRIHQLRLDNNIWHPKELTLSPGAAPAFFEVRAYVHYAPSPATQHEVYLGKDNQGLLDDQVHELYADDNNDWHHNNLTTAVPGGAKLALTSPTGYEFRHLQHVIYQGIDSHIYELWHDSNGWHVNDLTNAPAVAIGPLTARVFTPIDTQNITFRGSGGAHIHELWWDNTGTWRRSDLTVASQTPLTALVSSDPTNYLFWQQPTQHINYLGTDGHVHELWWDYENGWQHNDLTFQTGAPPGGLPSGYVFSDQETQHVVYRGNDGHIHELWWDNSGWHHNNLTTGAPDALMAGGDPTGYEATSTPGHGTQHVIFASRDHHVIELKWTPP